MDTRTARPVAGHGRSGRVLGRTVVALLAVSGQSAVFAERLDGPQDGYGRMPLHFEENRGQTHPDVRYYGRGSGYAVFLTPSEVVLRLQRESTKAAAFPQNQDLADPGRFSSTVVRMRFPGANANPRIVAREEQPARSNYFIGNDPSQWRTDIALFGRVTYRDLYPGVDLACYGNERHLEFDLVVAPGADAAKVKMEFEGLAPLRLDDFGNLVLGTGSGDLVLSRPVVYQESDGKRSPVDGRYVIESPSGARVALEAYDSSRPLVIDPVLAYSTYLGGSHVEWPMAIAVDASGQAYLTGYTLSHDFPVRNALQPVHGGGTPTSEWPEDVFVTKLSSSGSTLIYSTYLGGISLDKALGIAVDASGNAYVTGRTQSWNFPLVNPFQSTATGQVNAFVFKLNPSGSALIYSTLLGDGSGGAAIAVDAAASAYVVGYGTVPLKNPLFPTGSGFLTKFAPSGSSLAYSTRGPCPTTVYGESSGGAGTSEVAVDGAGSAYVSGWVSAGGCTVLNAAQPTFRGTTDAYIWKVDSTGSTLAYATYLGGAGREFMYDLSVDGQGAAVLTGGTTSADFPTLSPFQSTLGGQDDAFVAKINPTGGRLVYSTFIGGASSDWATSVAVDAAGRPVIAGYTQSDDFPLKDPVNTPPSKGNAFVLRLNQSGSALLFSSQLGGGSWDKATGVALDGTGNIYVFGETQSSGFPTVHPFQATNAGMTDAFVTRIVASTRLVSVSPPAAPLGATFTIAGSGFTAGSGATLHLQRAGAAELLPRQVVTDGSGRFTYDLNALGAEPGNYLAWAIDNSTGAASDTTDFTILSADSCLVTCGASVPATADLNDPVGFTATATPSLCTGTAEFAWDFGDGGSATTRKAQHSYGSAGTYSWAMTATIGGLDCRKTGTVAVGTRPARFTFSDIGSPQTVGLPFTVTVGATDAAGVGVPYYGPVLLEVPGGGVSQNIQMRGSSWTGQLTLKLCGFNLTVHAASGGAFGESNQFHASDGTSCRGRIEGSVLDNALPAAALQNALVAAEDGIGLRYSVRTASDGTYRLDALPGGPYELWAEYGTAVSNRVQVTVRGSQTVRWPPLSVPTTGDTSQLPVILVPGILGSTDGDYGMPSVPAKAPAKQSALEIWDGWWNNEAVFPSGWADLRTALRPQYTQGVTLFDCPWDWRVPLADAAGRYLEPCIKLAKDKTGHDKVDIIAHSMGGLLARTYVQGLAKKNGAPLPYGNDVRRAAFVGTPHLGSPLPYYMWVGGDPYTADEVNSPHCRWFTPDAVCTYSAVTEETYRTMTGEWWELGDKWAGTFGKIDGAKLKTFYATYVPTMGQLMSTPDQRVLLDAFGDPRARQVTNPFLTTLNSIPFPSGIEVKAFVGIGNDTLRTIRTGDDGGVLWTPGAPLEPPVGGAGYEKDAGSTGDGTVPRNSARAPCDTLGGWAECVLGGGNGKTHAGLIGVFQSELASFVSGTASPDTESPKATQVSATPRLWVRVEGGVQPELADPSGAVAGIDPDTGDGTEGIPGSRVKIDGTRAYLTVEAPPSGAYTVTLKATSPQRFGVEVSYLDGQTTKSEYAQGYIGSGVLVVAFSLDPTAEVKVRLVHPPSPPTSVRADPIARGSLMTRLSWIASADAGVVGYRVYAASPGDQGISLVGESPTNAFEPGHPWADTAAKTRVYVVSARRGDGSEGFLSKAASNDDSDHDGVTDEQEALAGTDPSDPDSDHDGLTDAQEMEYGTDPRAADTDGDGFSDADEVKAGSDALDPASVPGWFYTVTPCRVFDTREVSGPTLGTPLTCGTERNFAVAGKCGVPSSATAVSVNLTGTTSTAQGNLRLFPAGEPTPLVSTLNYTAGLTRANNAVVALGTDGQISILCSPSGTTHVVLDVNGYFQ